MDAGTQLFRLTRTQHSDPAFFGRLHVYRFDAPDRSYGVCYLGTTLACCLLEVFDPQRDTLTGRLSISDAQVRAYYAALATANRSLRLAYLADDGLAQLGIDQRHTAGDDYDLSGTWSAALHAHTARIDGIFYSTRHHNGLYAVALFERAAPAVSFRRWGVLGDRSVADLWIATDAAFARFHVDIL